MNNTAEGPTVASVLQTFHSQHGNKSWADFPEPGRVETLSQEIGADVCLSPPRPQIPALLWRLRQGMAEFKGHVYVRHVGTVQQIGNGVARLSGLPNARTDELVTFPTGVNGMVLNLARTHVDVILLGPDEGIQGGDMVTGSGDRLRVPVGPALLGRVVNPLGEPLDGSKPVEATDFHFLERDAPGIIDREPVSEPLHTGLKIVDALVPIGRGQRELIIGSRQTGKTALAVDAILNQRAGGVSCLYVAIGQKKSSTLAVIDTLRRAGALATTTVVLASPDDPPALRYLAPYAGCTMAEALMRQGHDVLIVYDDLSKHADAYRELSLLLRRPPGREAYPGDIFYLHARLLERACKLNAAAGGASLTALPIVQIQRGNISAYIPTNLISITDGQIVLDADRFNQGLKPALNIGASISRVGGAAQTRGMRKLAGSLRLDLAQFEEVAHFTRFGTEVDETTQRQIQRGKRLQAVLTQPVHQPLSLGQQILTLWPATAGYLDDIPLEKVSTFETELLRYAERTQPELLHQLNQGSELTERMEAALKQLVEGHHTRWLKGSEGYVPVFR